MKKRTVVYVRVSGNSQDLASQLPDLKKWVAVHGGGDEIVWLDDHFTGKLWTRPGWTKVWEAIEAGGVRRLVVWRIDRLGRTTLELVKLYRDLEERGVTLVSIKENIDRTSAAGKLFADMLAAFAAFETEVRRERVVAGIAAARAAGKRIGGSGKGRLKADGKPKARATDPLRVKQVLELDEKGWSRASIAKATKTPPTTVYRVLNEAGRRMKKRPSDVAPAPITPGK